MTMEPVPQKTEPLAPGAVGAGGGTLATYLIHKFTSDPDLKVVLFHFVPGATLALGALAYKAFESHQDRQREKKESQALKKFREVADSAIKDEHLSPEHKAQVKKKVEDMNIAKLDDAFNEYQKVKGEKKP